MPLFIKNNEKVRDHYLNQWRLLHTGNLVKAFEVERTNQLGKLLRFSTQRFHKDSQNHTSDLPSVHPPRMGRHVTGPTLKLFNAKSADVGFLGCDNMQNVVILLLNPDYTFNKLSCTPKLD